VHELFIRHDTLAKDLLIATVVLASLAEVLATFLGRDRSLRSVRESVTEGLLLRRQAVAPADRRTKQLLVASMLVAILVAYRIAADDALRVGANRWGTFGLGLAIAVAGVLLRSWGVLTLGRYFRREVVVVEGQPVITSGPYRWLRHPGYAGNMLTAFGIGLALGSWLGALVCVTITFLGHLPRIRTEEAELERALGDDYVRYEGTTARLVPGLW
jgi:protein-S-isoprenylcysteine O-methyltransferase Ste14